MQQTSSRNQFCTFQGWHTGKKCRNAALDGHMYCGYHLGPLTLEKARDRVFAIIADETGFDFDELSEEMRLVDDLDCDSIDTVEVVMRLEDELNLEIPDEDAVMLQSVGDVVTYVSDYLRKKEGSAPPTESPVTDIMESKPEGTALPQGPSALGIVDYKARHTGRILSRIIQSELFRQYYAALELDEDEVVQLFRQVMGNRRIYYVTPVVGYKDEQKQEPECVHLFLLGKHNLFYFKLLSKSVRFEWAALKDLRLHYEVSLDDDKKISMISVTTSLSGASHSDADYFSPAPGGVDCHSEMKLRDVAFDFVGDEIKGALEFLDEYLNNLEGDDE